MFAAGMLRMDEQNARAPKPMLKAIFFDAVGTLFYLTKTVGDHYAFVGEEVGLSLNAKKLDAAFHSAWKQMPPREAIDSPRENDDKDWWREIGADKPNPEIFRRALKFLELQPGHVLHVGDDPERDWKTAAGAGLMIFKLDRNKNSLRDLIPLL